MAEVKLNPLGFAYVNLFIRSSSKPLMLDLPYKVDTGANSTSINRAALHVLGFVEKINEAVKWGEVNWQISPGGLLKALIISTFQDIRAPLYRLQERLEEIDTGYLIGEGADLKNVNSSNVGRALERLGEADCDSQYEQLALSAIHLNEIPLTRLHGDTTTISFHGEYDEGEMELAEAKKEELLRIEKGYNKDGRAGDNQVVVGQIVNELGIPLVSRTLNGSTSDTEWNKEAVNYLETIVS